MKPNSTDRFVGINMPETADDCLRLQSHFQKVGKSVMIRNIVLEYVKDNKWTVDGLIERYAKAIYNAWDLQWRDSIDFHDYIEEQKVQMKGPFKLPDRLITPIIEKCREKHQKNQSGTK